MKAPRIVCDSTVLVEAVVHPRGVAAKVLRTEIERRRVRFVLSAPVEDEHRRALLDPEVLERSGLDAVAVDRFLSSLALLADWIDSEALVGATSASGAEPTLEAARLAAPAIVLTSDRDLLARAGALRIDALTPVRYLELREAFERSAGLVASL